MSKPTKIILDKQSDLILTNAQIVGPTGIVKSDIPDLVTDLANLDTAIQSEAAARAAAIDTQKVRIDAILEGADTSLDQFREVVQFVNDIDTTNQNSLISIYGSMSAAYIGLSASLNQIITDLPDADGTTLEVSEGLIRLKDTVAAGAEGIRTFEGDNKAGVQPNTLETYSELSFVTKGILDDALRATAKDWNELALRFADDAVLSQLNFPSSLDFLSFVNSFYNLEYNESGTYANFILSQYEVGSFGASTVRKDQVIDALTILYSVNLPFDLIQAATNLDSAAFNGVSQVGKYFELIEVAVERFNEAVKTAHMLEEVRANVKNWNELQFRFADDAVLNQFDFPGSINFMSFVNNFYNNSFGGMISEQYSGGQLGSNTERKSQVVNLITDLTSVYLPNDLLTAAANNDVETFNKVYQVEKYFEGISIAVERFNEAVKTAHMLEEVRANVKNWNELQLRFADDAVLNQFDFPGSINFMSFVNNFYNNSFGGSISEQYNGGQLGSNTERKSQVVNLITDLTYVYLPNDLLTAAANNDVETFNKVYQVEKYFESIEIAVERFNEAVKTAHMIEEVRANVKNWNEVTLRFADDAILNQFDFPESMIFIDFVNNFYNNSFGGSISEQYSGGAYGSNTERKSQVVNLITDLTSVYLPNDLLTAAANNDVETFNKVYQVEKYFESIEIVVERFNEAVKTAHMIEEVRANVKNWNELQLRFTEDATLSSFSFPTTMTFMDFVNSFYNNGYATNKESSYYNGEYGDQNQRKQSLINAILRLDDLNLPNDLLTAAANNDVETFNKVYQIEKYYEEVEIAIERFNESVISVQLQLQIDSLSTEIDTNINTTIDVIESDLQTEINNRVAGDSYLQSEIDLMPMTDGETIDVDQVQNVIRLKEVVSAPESGVRVFEGDIKVGVQPDTLTGSYNDLSLITKGIMDSRLSQEVSTINNSISEETTRAQNAETQLQSNIDTQTVRIDAILEAADGNYDNFVEIVNLINSVDTENDQAFASYVISNNERLTIEENERLRLTNLLGDGLINEQIAREDGDAFIQHEIDLLPLTDGETIEVNFADNTIRLKEVVDAPDSGYRTFRGDVKAETQPENNISFNELSFVTKGWVDQKIFTDLDVTITDLTDAINAEEDARTQADAALDAAKLNLAGGTMTGSIDMDGNDITDVNTIIVNTSLYSQNPTQFIISTDSGKILIPNSNLDLNNNGKVTNLPAPTADGDATNKLYVDSAISSEESARIAGDEALSTSIDNLQTYVNETVDSAISTLTSDLAEETARAESAESALQSAIDAEVAAREAAIAEEHAHHTAAEAQLQSNIDYEKTRIDAILIGASASADNFAEIVALINSVDTENDQAFAGYVLSNDAALAAEVAARIADVDAEEARALLAEDEISSNLSAEVAARIADVDAEETRALAAETALSATFSAALAAEVAARIADVQAEAVRRIAQDDQLASDLAEAISTEAAARIAGDAQLSATFSAAISTEEAARIAGDAQLSSDLADLQSYVDTTVDSAIATLTSDLAAETSARIADVDAEEARALAAEGVLQTNINTEANERAAEDITLQGNIDIEATRAQAAETAIAADLGTETTARIAGDAQLSSDLAALSATFSAAMVAEVSRATAAEGVLQGNIDYEKSRIDAILIGASASADNFAEIVALINSVDTTNDTAFASYVLSNDAALAAEAARATAAEGVLTSDLAAEVSRALVAEDEISSNLTTEVARAEAAEATLTAALSAEETSRIAGDAALQASLNNEISDRIAAGQAAQAALDTEAARATAAEAALSATFSAALSAEEVARIAGDAALSATFSAAISAEVSRATAAELVLTNDFANIYSKKVAVIGTPNGTMSTFYLDKYVRVGSEMIYVNGLLMEEGQDYTTILSSGKVSGVQFFTSSVPLTDMRILAYGVCGTASDYNYGYWAY